MSSASPVSATSARAALDDLAEAHCFHKADARLRGFKGVSFEQVGRVNGVPAAAQRFGKVYNAQSQALGVMEKQHFSHCYAPSGCSPSSHAGEMETLTIRRTSPTRPGRTSC